MRRYDMIMDYDEIDEALMELQDEYYDEFTEEKLKEVLAVQNKYIEKALIDVGKGRVDAADFLFNGYSGGFLNEEGTLLFDFAKASHVYDNKVLWRQSTFCAIGKSTACISEGRAGEIGEMIDYYASRPDYDITDEQKDDVVILGAARKLAEAVASNKNSARGRAIFIAKDFWEQCKKEGTFCCPDDIDVSLGIIFYQSGDVGIGFANGIASYAVNALESGEPMSIACRTAAYAACKALYRQYYLVKSSSEYMAVYWLGVMIAFAAKYGGAINEDAADYHDSMYSLIEKTTADFTKPRLSKEASEMARKACGIISKFDAMGDAGLAACALSSGQYPANTREICTKVLQSSFVAENYPIYTSIANICLFRNDLITFDVFRDHLGGVMDKIAAEKDEDMLKKIWVCLVYSEMTLLAQRFIFFFEDKLPTAFVLTRAGMYYLEPLGDINQDLEKAYQAFSKAAKAGSEPAKEKLTHFKRSLLGKISYN